MSFEEDLDKFRLDPVSKAQAETRLSPLAWPATLDADGGIQERKLSSAFLEAKSVYDAFSGHYQTTARDGRLTPEGVKAELATWAERELPKLQVSMDTIRAEINILEQNFAKRVQNEVLGDYASDPTEPNDIALAQEIRAFLRTIPAKDRTEAVRQFFVAGDKAAMRAVLSAPSYLSGVDQEFLTLVRDDMVRRSAPDRFAKIDAIREGKEATLRAMDYVVRHIGSSTGTLVKVRDPDNYNPAPAPTRNPFWDRPAAARIKVA